MTVRVLVVDDAADIRLLLRMWIENAPERLAVVGEAASAAEALATIEDVDPDVVLLDARMPAVDGFEAARMILARRPWQRMVLYTATVDSDLREKAIAAGFVDCVAKDDYGRLPSVIVAAAGSPADRH